MKTGVFLRTSFLVGAILVAANFPTRAESYYVAVDDRGFLPATLNVNAGDTVVWINTDEFFSHSTTSDLQFPDPDAWHAILIDFEDTFVKTFINAGTFTYKDQLDTGTGTIIVTSVNQAPEITLASPRVMDGQFLFEATGLTVGKANVMEFSTNLVHWTAMRTNLADSLEMTFTNNFNPGARFFRVHQLP
jgi:plastocyanin